MWNIRWTHVLAGAILMFALPGLSYAASGAGTIPTPVVTIPTPPMDPAVKQPADSVSARQATAPSVKDVPPSPSVPEPPSPRAVKPASKPAASQKTPAADGDPEKDDDADTKNSRSTVPPRMVPRPAQDPEVLLRRGIVRVELRPVQLRLLSAPHSSTLSEVMVRDGELVEEQQPVAQLDTARDEGSLAKARDDLNAVVDRLRDADISDERTKNRAESDLARAADRVRAFDEKISASHIVAPFAGRITEIRAKPGQHLKQGDVIAELSGIGELEIVATIPSTWVRHLEPGHLIWVYVDETAKSYEAEFVRFGGKVDSSSRTIRAYARFRESPPEILPGMSGSANYWPPRKQAQ